MSQQNIDIVKAAVDSFNRRDWDGAFQHAAPGAEVDMSRAIGPLNGVFRLDEIRRMLLEFAGHWESVRIELNEFIEADNLLVIPLTMHGRGRDGIEVTARVAVVWTVRDGAIERVAMYQERQDALDAVGITG